MAVGVELLELRAGDLVQSIAEKVWAFPHLKRGDLLRIVAVDAHGIVSYEVVAPYLRHADCLETFTPTAAVKWMREKPFWVTGVLNDRLTNEARGILVNALKTGEPLAVTVEKLATAFEPYRGNPNVLKDGEPPSPHRLETIVRTNTTEAYNQGRIASPECTNHTPAKGSAKRCEASRETAFQVLRFARAFKPRWIIVENVIQMRRWSRYKEFIERFSKLGYHVRDQVLNAKDYGAPQTRRRLFILCDREQAPQEVRTRKNRKLLTVADVLDPRGTWDMTPLFNGRRADNTVIRYLTALLKMGPNKPFLLVYYGTDGGGGWQRLDRPLRTITTVDRFALVEQGSKEPKMRMLQVSELQRAMGFSVDYRFKNGTRRDRIKIIGNAVCPPMMKAVVKTLTKGSSAQTLRQKSSRGDRS